MKISTIIIGLLLMATVIVGMYAFVNDLAGPNAYNVAVDSQYLDSFDQTQLLTANISARYDEIQDFSTKKGSAIQIITLVPDALALMIDLVQFPFVVFKELVYSIMSFMSFAPWIQTFLLAIFTVVIAFALIAAILRWLV